MGARANAVFDAVYMLCRVILKGEDDGWEHPDPRVLLRAAELLGWSADTVLPAVEHLRDWYVPEVAGAQYDKLMTLAGRVEADLANRH
jgi:hypothetical protein